ncbi:MAG: hypothetical protein Q8P68_03170 [Candidatus Peregrinibacteria bacterium]|nr:hypothetical protein [Candidatus Peregrinibacteria bacterium]
MPQKELKILIARNRLLSWEQKYVLLEKASSLGGEQITKLIAYFKGSNEKMKGLMISKIKESDLQKKALESVFHRAKKMALKVNGNVVSEDESEGAETYLEDELDKMKPKAKTKESFFRRLLNFFINLINK